VRLAQLSLSLSLLQKKGNYMRIFLAAGIAATVLAMTGCNNAKSPDDVAKEVANAEQKSATEVSKSEDKAAKDLGGAADKVDDKLIAFNNDAARDAYNLAVAKADGDRKVALANCDSVSGDAQKACKHQADADYDAAKANAKAVAESQKQ
jgi:hypothetical protein